MPAGRVVHLKHIFTWKSLHSLGANAHHFTEGSQAWLNPSEVDGKAPGAGRNQIKRVHIVPSTQVRFSKGNLGVSATTKPCPMCLCSLKIRFSFYQTQSSSLPTKTYVRKKHCNSQLHAENVCRAEEAKLLIIIIAQQVQNNSSSSPSSNTLMNQRNVQKAQCSLDENVTSWIKYLRY